MVSMKSLDCIKNRNGLKLTNLAFRNLNIINFWLPDFGLSLFKESLFKESFGKSITLFIHLFMIHSIGKVLWLRDYLPNQAEIRTAIFMLQFLSFSPG